MVESHKTLTWAKRILENCPDVTYYGENFYSYKDGYYKRETDFVLKVLKLMQEDDGLQLYASKYNASSIVEHIKAIKLYEREDSSIHFHIKNELPEDCVTFIVMKKSVLQLFNDGTVKTVEHSPDYFSLSRLEFEMNEDSKDCPIFMQYLEKMQPDPEVRKTLQEIMGYFLLAGFNQLHLYFIFYGSGANGKSVFTKVMRALLGDNNVSALGLNAFDENAHLLPVIVGKFANICEDLSYAGSKYGGTLKKVVSGEKITVNPKSRDAITFIPSIKILFCTNFIPNSSDLSNGTTRRCVIIPWEQEILESKEQRKELSTVKFWKKSGELSAIFNWALEGTIRILSRGENRTMFIAPSIKKASTFYQEQSNPVLVFLKEHYTYVTTSHEKFSLIEEDHYSNANDMYSHFCAWCKDNRHKPCSADTFKKRILIQFPEIKNKHEIKSKTVELKGGPHSFKSKRGLSSRKEFKKTRTRIYPYLIEIFLLDELSQDDVQPEVNDFFNL